MTEQRKGVLLTREQLEAWAGRSLTDEQVDDLDVSIPNSSIPEAIATITEALYGDEEEPVSPTAELRKAVKDVIDNLLTDVEQIDAEVYWQDTEALIVVPGEKHVRKQQAILVHARGRDTMSAKVGGWGTGVRDTRV